MEITAEQMEALAEETVTSISREAAEELAEVLENYIGYITEEAGGQARESGRDVITRADIVEAEK